MAHEITIRADGTAEMFSLRQNPWHGLGAIIQNELTDSEVRKVAGLDWDVVEEPIYAADMVAVTPTDTVTTHSEIKGHKCLRRSDSKAVLGVVSQGYRTFNNQEVIDLMRRIAGETPVVWETAGSLRGGRDVWALGHLPDLSLDIKGDKSRCYMLIHTGHGNGKALVMVPTVVRVVCANTARMALGSKHDEQARHMSMERRDFSAAALSKGYSIRHSGKLDEAVKDAANAYHRLIRDKLETERQANAMAERVFNPKDVAAYWDMVFRLGATEAMNEEEKAKAMKRREKVHGTLNRVLASPTCRQPGTVDTYYALAQAAVEYLDHERGGNQSGATGRFAYANFDPQGVAIKDRAWTGALALATA